MRRRAAPAAPHALPASHRSSVPPPVQVVAGLVAALLAAVPLAAQQPPSRGAAPAVTASQGVVASINNAALTSSDVGYYARLVVGTDQAVDEGTWHEVRRRIAGQILLSQEASRLGVELTHAEVEEYWKDRYGTAPDFEEASAASGTSLEHQKELAKVQVLAEIYLLHQLGLGGRWAHRIAPDPVLARDVDVRPEELKAFFLEHRKEFDEPPAVVYDVYPCPDGEAAAIVLEGLRSGETPTGRRPVRELCPLDALEEYFAGEPGLSAFLAEAQPGDVSEPHPTRGAVLVVKVVERRAGKPADWNEVQAPLRRRIRSDRIVAARDKLVRRLERGAVYWPSDLFAEQPPRTQGDPPPQEGSGAAPGAGVERGPVPPAPAEGPSPPPRD